MVIHVLWNFCQKVFKIIVRLQVIRFCGLSQAVDNCAGFCSGNGIAERLQGFDDDWTNSGMPKRMRYFSMGNALVVPMITRMGEVLDGIMANEP
jgi:hypothetical protein